MCDNLARVTGVFYLHFAASDKFRILKLQGALEVINIEACNILELPSILKVYIDTWARKIDP